MNSLLLNNSSIWLTAALIIVSALLGIVALGAFIARIVVFVKYQKYNRTETSVGHTAYSAARNLLDQNGMQDVEVKQLGFFRALFYGNSYSARTKTIYLRRGIINKTSITAVGLACQKVGLAIQDKENNKAFKFRSAIAPVIVFAPVIVVPIILIGFLIDFLLSLGGIAAIVAVVVGVLVYLVGFIFTILTIPVESRGNKLALELIEKTKFLNEEETYAIKEVFSVYIIAYVLEFVVALLQLIKFILQILLKLVKNK